MAVRIRRRKRIAAAAYSTSLITYTAMEPPRLRTDRLLLREYRPSDVEPHARASLDEEAQRFLGGVKAEYDAFTNLATHAGHWALRGYGSWVVAPLDDPDRYFGRIGLWQPAGWPGLECGWKLAPDAWGHGYAPEAARAAIGWAFTALDQPEVISLIDPANGNSQRVAQKLGHENAGPVETPFGTADRWVLRRPDGAWAFRDATPDDAPRLAHQLREAFARFRDISPPGWEPPPAPDDEIAASLQTPGARCVVSMPGGVLAGHVAWRPSIGARRGPQDAAAAYLGRIYLEPAWWATPLATTLMTFALDGARAEGYARMHLVTPAAAGRARRFYERLGYRTVAPPANDERFGMPTVEYAREL
jgi:RimJ/RimL family protein N-acetyltransferase